MKSQSKFYYLEYFKRNLATLEPGWGLFDIGQNSIKLAFTKKVWAIVMHMHRILRYLY